MVPQVVTFGSVPLKTYLPDGDIDLTAFSLNHVQKDTWAEDVHRILEKAEQNSDSEFRVKEVQLIHAEVLICSFCLFCGCKMWVHCATGEGFCL
jgi:DNA polymerase sigma